MARGWDSKDVESQREVRIEPFSAADKPISETEHKRENLELARTRLLRELQTVCHPRFRGQLEAELAHIDAALKDLPAKPAL